MFFVSRYLPLIALGTLIISVSVCATASETISKTAQGISEPISKNAALPLDGITTSNSLTSDGIASVADINPNVAIFNEGLQDYSKDVSIDLIDFDIMEPDMIDMPSNYTSNSCAMNLKPIAKNIYASISPKVRKDTNLRKLMKKEIRPQVFSGKLSVKSARENAQAASVCLSLLKAESGDV